MAWEHRKLLVVPPNLGGLHCGRFERGQLAAGDRVVPPNLGGLHCGNDMTARVLAQREGVVPPNLGGLHCGHVNH